VDSLHTTNTNRKLQNLKSRTEAQFVHPEIIANADGLVASCPQQTLTNA